VARERAGRGQRYADLGPQFETAVARRERLADNYDIDYGSERVFPRLVDAMLEEVPPGARVLEVGAATGVMTRPLLGKAGHVTAMEPSHGLLHRLLSSDVADSPKLRTMPGIVEELPARKEWDVAVVTFTPRRGIALLRVLTELAKRVKQRVVIMLPDDTSMDWAYLARSASSAGLETRLRFVHGNDGKRAVLMTAEVDGWQPTDTPTDWAVDAREVSVPYPAPRGAATRLVRYFLSTGDRALTLDTDERGAERLYGNLRTAAHRLARDVVTVRRQGDVIQLVRLPRAAEPGDDGDSPWPE
jgi:hypothetical protein